MYFICMFQEDASGCHVENNKSERPPVETEETTGIARKEVMEAGRHVGNGENGGKGLIQERLRSRVCR